MVQTVKNMVQHESHFILEVIDNGFSSFGNAGMCVFEVEEGLQSIWIDQEGQRRDKATLNMLCVLDGLLDVLVKGVKLVKFLLYLVSSHGWLGLSTQTTPREVDSHGWLGLSTQTTPREVD
nr:hypothetical protein [Tanacetum cinerariifolium]